MDFSEDEYDELSEEEMHQIDLDPMAHAINIIKNRNRDWVAEAACKGMDTDLFFLDQFGQAANTERLKIVRPLCKECPVRQQCLEYAVDNSIDIGIWGGLTGRERRKYRNGRRG